MELSTHDFSVWQRVASESLLHTATCPEDHMQKHLDAARRNGERAYQYADNDIQRALASGLLAAVDEISRIVGLEK